MANPTSVINGVLKLGYTTNNWFLTGCVHVCLSLSLYPFLFCLSSSVPTLPLPLPSSLLSLCSTVFILLQPPCFCGAVSVVDTMKTGRIHYLALHSSHPLWFSLLTSSYFFTLAFNNEYIFSSFYFFPTSSLGLSCFVLLQFFLPLLVFTLFSFCSMHLSANDWLILTIYLSPHLALCWYQPTCTAFMLLPKLTVKNNLNSFFFIFLLFYRHSEKHLQQLLFLQKVFKFSKESLAMESTTNCSLVKILWNE